MKAFQIYATETWLLIAEMGPYLLLGFLFAGALHRWIRETWIETRLGKPGLKSITLGSIVGVPIPLCSCGVIPVTASLRDKGASKGAAASFLTSTPQTGVDSILATYGMLGPVFAIYRVIVAFISGIAVGTIVDRFSAPEMRKSPDPTTAPEPIPSWRQSIRYGLITMPADIAVSLVIGFLLAGLISALAPDDLLSNLPGGVYTSILLTTLIATPFYICSTGSIPLALALIDSGLPVSAALVLLIAGPATNIATITTMRKTLGGRETAIYVASIVIVSWVAALVFHQFFDTKVFDMGHLHEMGPTIWNHIAGAAMLAMLGYAYWTENYRDRAMPVSASGDWADDPEKATLRIEGMTCSHCRQSAVDGLTSLPFTSHVEVDLKSGNAQLGGNGLDRNAISDKLDSLGFSVTDFSLQTRENN